MRKMKRKRFNVRIKRRYEVRSRATKNVRLGWRSVRLRVGVRLETRIRYGKDWEGVVKKKFATIDDIPEWYLKNMNVDKFNIPLDDELLNALLTHKSESMFGTIQDLYGAITKNKLGYGHSNSYYNKAGFVSMQHHETFANLTACYTHKNPAFWNHIKKEMPELAKYFDDLLDKVNSGELNIN